MWDEEKFFKDFAEATDQIKPDAAFVEQLKEKMNSENVAQLEKRMQKKRQIRYIAAAAVAALCVGAGGIGFSMFGGTGNRTQGNVPHAEKDNPSKETAGSVKGSDQVLSNVIAMLEEPSNMVDDAQGNSLSTQERENLVEMLKHSKKLEDSVEISSIDFTNESKVYYCVGDETVKIEISKEEYARIEDSVYSLK